jgi:hypothetical protein
MDLDTPPEPNASVGSPNGEAFSFLQELDVAQWKRTGMPVITMVREWPDGSVDTLIVLNSDTAYGRREDGHHRPMKQERGAANEVARLMQQLPLPGTPGAPDEPIPDRSEPMM